MTEERRSLHELCRRVAAGDQEARMEFSRDVAPLVEFITRRWLSTKHRRAPREKAAPERLGDPSSRNASNRVCEADVARVARRICRSLIQRIGQQPLRATAETLVQRLRWPTQTGPAAD